MLKDIWALLTDPSFICLTFFVLWILTIQKKKRVEYYLAGRLANQHTIDNLLVNSMSISDTDKQILYLKYVAKFVKYGFNCQDKSTIAIGLEIDQVLEIIKGHEISNECEIIYEIDIEEEQLALPVIPFSIITILENALSYGGLNNADNKLKISLIMMENNLYRLEFTGYSLPDKLNLNKPVKGHGLFILKQRLKFIHFDKNTNSVKGNRYIFLSPDGLSLNMILPK